MKHVSVLVPKGAVELSCVQGSLILFTKANEFLALRGKQPLFTVQLVGLSGEPQVYDRLFTVAPETTLEKVRKTDLIIIPAVNGDKEEVIAANRRFLPKSCTRACQLVVRGGRLQTDVSGREACTGDDHHG